MTERIVIREGHPKAGEIREVFREKNGWIGTDVTYGAAFVGSEYFRKSDVVFLWDGPVDPTQIQPCVYVGQTHGTHIRGKLYNQFPTSEYLPIKAVSETAANPQPADKPSEVEVCHICKHEFRKEPLVGCRVKGTLKAFRVHEKCVASVREMLPPGEEIYTFDEQPKPIVVQPDDGAVDLLCRIADIWQSNPTQDIFLDVRPDQNIPPKFFLKLRSNTSE